MPKALVIEIDTNPSPTAAAAQILSHGRAVRSEFLSGLSGWECGILLVSNREGLSDQEANVDAIIAPSQTYGGVEIVDFVNANHGDYALFIMSYVVDQTYRNNLVVIPDTLGKPLFMPVPNTPTVWYVERSSIINVGGGSTTNVRAIGEGLWFYDLTSTGSTTTSFTTATVARKATQIIDDGYTSFTDVASILVQNADNASAWNYTDGFGRLPAVLTIPEPGAIPDPELEPGNPSAPEYVPLKPVPTLFVNRSGTVNTLDNDGGGAQAQYQKRDSADAEWTEASSPDSQPADVTRMYRVRVLDGETLSDWSDTVYAIASKTSRLKTHF